MANYEITVYEINKQVYDKLMQNPANRKILENVRPVKRACVKKSVKLANGVVINPLSMDDVKNLLGAGVYANCICYNLDAREYNRKAYNGVPVYNNVAEAHLADKVKLSLQQLPEFKNIEPLVVTAMTTDSVYYTKSRVWAPIGEHFSDGNCVIINMIVRNTKNGQVEVLNKKWFNAWVYPGCRNASQLGINDFLHRLVRDGNYRRAFAAIARQYE